MGHYWPVSLRLACIYSNYWSLGDLELIFILGTDITIYQNWLLLLGEVGHNWPVSLMLACIYSNNWSLGDLELIFILGTDIAIYQNMLLLQERWGTTGLFP